jgi:hypothetical protein
VFFWDDFSPSTPPPQMDRFDASYVLLYTHRRNNFSRKATRFWASRHGVIVFLRSRSLLLLFTPVRSVCVHAVLVLGSVPCFQRKIPKVESRYLIYIYTYIHIYIHIYLSNIILFIQKILQHAVELWLLC